MISPYSSSKISIGLTNQIITIFRFEDTVKDAFIDLVTSCNDPETDFNEEYESICHFHKIDAENAQKIFHAYEALYAMVAAKKATERALKDNNAQVIKQQLEDIQRFAFELEQEPKEMMALTEQQTTDLQTYLDKLKEYERVFSE